MKTELLNKYFTSVFTPHSSEPPSIISDTSFPDIATISVDINGVLNLLNELDISKATGPDCPFSETMCYWSGSYFDTYISSIYLSIQCSTWLETSKYCPNIQKKRPYPLQQLQTCIINMHMLQDFGAYYAFTHILPPLTTQHIVQWTTSVSPWSILWNSTYTYYWQLCRILKQ